VAGHNTLAQLRSFSEITGNAMTYGSLDPAPKAFDQRKRLNVVRAVAVMAMALLLFAKPFLSEGSKAHEFLELLGFVLVLICVVGRLWSILYVGGRKNDELVSMGPFSLSAPWELDWRTAP
jgi:protein-S-isoprenylcysteine O-methyltransferase Ste14